MELASLRWWRSWGLRLQETCLVRVWRRGNLQGLGPQYYGYHDNLSCITCQDRLLPHTRKQRSSSFYTMANCVLFTRFIVFFSAVSRPLEPAEQRNNLIVSFVFGRFSSKQLAIERPIDSGAQIAP